MSSTRSDVDVVDVVSVSGPAPTAPTSAPMAMVVAAAPPLKGGDLSDARAQVTAAPNPKLINMYLDTYKNYAGKSLNGPSEVKFGRFDAASSAAAAIKLPPDLVLTKTGGCSPEESTGDRDRDAADDAKEQMKAAAVAATNPTLSGNRGVTLSRIDASDGSAQSGTHAGLPHMAPRAGAKHLTGEQIRRIQMERKQQQMAEQQADQKRWSQGAGAKFGGSQANRSRDARELREQDRHARYHPDQFKQPQQQQSSAQYLPGPAPAPPRPQHAPLVLPPILSRRDSGQAVIKKTVLWNYRISCFVVGGEPRLCLPQMLNTLLDKLQVNDIHQGCEALQINVSSCTREQLEALKQHEVIPVTAPSCGLISRSDAERLCSYLLERNPPRVAGFETSVFAFKVEHECFGKCVGVLLPEAALAPTSRCIECLKCRGAFSPPRFVAHTHDEAETRTCHWGFDSANWRSFLHLWEGYESGAETLRERLEKRLQDFKDNFPTAATATVSDGGRPELKRSNSAASTESSTATNEGSSRPPVPPSQPRPPSDQQPRPNGHAAPMQQHPHPPKKARSSSSSFEDYFSSDHGGIHLRNGPATSAANGPALRVLPGAAGVPPSGMSSDQAYLYYYIANNSKKGWGQRMPLQTSLPLPPGADPAAAAEAAVAAAAAAHRLPVPGAPPSSSQMDPIRLDHPRRGSSGSTPPVGGSGTSGASGTGTNGPRSGSSLKSSPASLSAVESPLSDHRGPVHPHHHTAGPPYPRDSSPVPGPSGTSAVDGGGSGRPHCSSLATDIQTIRSELQGASATAKERTLLVLERLTKRLVEAEKQRDEFSSMYRSMERRYKEKEEELAKKRSELRELLQDLHRERGSRRRSDSLGSHHGSYDLLPASATGTPPPAHHASQPHHVVGFYPREEALPPPPPSNHVHAHAMSHVRPNGSSRASMELLNEPAPRASYSPPPRQIPDVAAPLQMSAGPPKQMGTLPKVELKSPARLIEEKEKEQARSARSRSNSARSHASADLSADRPMAQMSQQLAPRGTPSPSLAMLAQQKQLHHQRSISPTPTPPTPTATAAPVQQQAMMSPVDSLPRHRSGTPTSTKSKDSEDLRDRVISMEAELRALRESLSAAGDNSKLPPTTSAAAPAPHTGAGPAASERQPENGKRTHSESSLSESVDEPEGRKAAKEAKAAESEENKKDQSEVVPAKAPTPSTNHIVAASASAAATPAAERKPS